MSKLIGPNKYPCFRYPGGCPNRSPGCRSKCIEMLCAELEADERKKTARRNRRAACDVKEAEIHGCLRMTKKKPKER